jgi:hypothetical protein
LPLRVGCQSRATLGAFIAREFVREARCPEQKGQPAGLMARVRFVVSARHSWSRPLGHFHQFIASDE